MVGAEWHRTLIYFAVCSIIVRLDIRISIRKGKTKKKEGRVCVLQYSWKLNQSGQTEHYRAGRWKQNTTSGDVGFWFWRGTGGFDALL